jgi:hypothetical protein
LRENSSRLLPTEFRRIVVGNSFARHLAGTFNVLSERLQGPTLLRFWGGCGLGLPINTTLYQPRHYSAVPYTCWNEKDERWKYFESLPRNATIIVAQNWKSTSEGENANLARQVAQMVTRIRELNHRAVTWGVPGNTMSLTDSARWCSVMKRSPSAILRWIATFLYCKVERRPPHPGFVRAHLLLKKLSSPAELDFPYMNIFYLFCPTLTNCPIEFETGNKATRWIYEGDGRHLTVEGSRHLGRLLLSEAISVRHVM